MSHDIFVSYAHADDVPAIGQALGWVSTFVDELRKLLTQKMGRHPVVWMDEKLAANEQVEETLREHVLNSRALLMFLSPSYLNSSWCASEMNAFLEKNPAVFHRESVFVAAVQHMERSSWPERLRALTPLELYVRERNGVTRRLGVPTVPSDPESPYWIKLHELVDLLARHLMSSGASAGQRPVEAPTPSDLLNVLSLEAAKQPRSERPQSATELTRRHKQLQALIERVAVPQAVGALAWIPCGALQLPSGLIGHVRRPVGIMTRPVSCHDVVELVPSQGTNARNVMATGLSMLDAQRFAESLPPVSSPFFWRLPRLEEWWMAMTAGTGVLPRATHQRGLWLSDTLPNAWRIQPLPSDTMEWVMASSSPAGVISSLGLHQQVRPDVRPERVGFRLVLDWTQQDTQYG